MNDIQKEILQSAQIDWSKLKQILCGMALELENICKGLPDGSIKSILCGIVGILNMICQMLPGLEKQE